MVDCENLIHPFQNDPGVSQRQRIMDDLLSGSAKIDGRSMADLLDYFVQLSRHVNYYDANLSISDWQPFFRKSIPFSLAAIIKYERLVVSDKIDSYNKLFDKRPSKTGLQLLLHYFFHRVINQVNTWHVQLKDSGLPAESIMEKLIRDKLRVPLAKFVCYHNAAVRWYCVKPLDLLRLAENDAWNLDLNRDAGDCKPKGKTNRLRLIALQNQVNDLIPAFLDAIRIIADVAAQNMEQSFFPLKEDLQKKHTPHLALLFAFLKLFQHLQGDLNKYTRKHLDFFYKQVLKLKTRNAIPDKVHIVFEIQKQLDKYLLKKGLVVKDGKDANKAEILFALDDEIVVNKTQTAEKRTLFLNNQDIVNETYVEGVYMAPNADKADGVKLDFSDNVPKSFATLGSKYSKYKDPEKARVSAYPNARIGFILASPVLLLNEGTRNITITLACQLDLTCVGKDYPTSFSPALLYTKVRKLAAKGYYYISQDLILEAAKKGISKPTLDNLWQFLFDKTREGCCGKETVYNSDTVVTARNWRINFYNGLSESEKTVLSELFRERRIFKILFSGKDEWIEPSNIRRIRFSTLDAVTKQFTITIKTRLKPDKPAVTFYDKEKLKEDFNTTKPLVKVELDDDIKIFRGFDVPATPCCLLIKTGNEKRNVSFYHFFRDVIIIGKTATHETKIDVRVCGLRNFVVQNDESVQDVNGPVYPFGTRPEIVDFDVVNPAKPPLANPNLVGPSFYIGSKEVFCKKWNDIFVNLKWKDKPSDFNEYYLAYWADPTLPPAIPPPGFKQKYGLDKDKFEINLSVLQDGKWKKELKHPIPSPLGPPPPHPAETTLENPVTHDKNRKLFPELNLLSDCVQANPFDQTLYLKTEFFDGLASQFNVSNENFGKYDVNSRHGFLKINLQNQDFLHKDYAFVLARQMMALGKYPDALLEGAVYREQGGTVIVFKNFGFALVVLKGNITATKNSADLVKNKSKDTYDTFNTAAAYNPPPTVFLPVPPNPEVPPPPIPFPPPPPFPLNTISDGERDDLISKIRDTYALAYDLNSKAFLTATSFEFLEKLYSFFDASGNVVKPLNIPIPNEPWTPVIKNISLDYTATAVATDIDLIHLYPYKDTYKQEEIELQPTLFPTFCDEGTLFIGLKDLLPGSNVNMLFQLAEATADSESDQEEIAWHYLDNNQWKSLRDGFEILDDATDGLTTSGIIRFGMPANMNKDNTILPKDLHWIKASIPKNSRTVSETIAIYTQAIRATFTNDTINDKLRLGQPLVASSISRLNDADANIKKLTQPYDTFGGRVPEAEGHFYVRVSEMLRHKGRAIQKFDYERLVLELFPQIFKAKCINHSFALNGHKYKNDFPIAPGYVLLVVIPDLNQLKAAQSYEPRVPVSMLDDIEEQLKKIISPFVRLRAMNPRYEKIHFCLTVKLVLGKDENYYKEKMKQDLREFLAPWAIGQYDKLTFGQCITRSEVVRFLETRDYVDYITELLMRHNDDNWPDKTKEVELIKPICPKTPRSILIAGDIDVCIPENDCEKWQEDKNCGNERIPISDYCLKNTDG